MRELALILLFLWHVLGHRTDLASARRLFATREWYVLLREEFVNQLRTVVRTVLLSLFEDSVWNYRHSRVLHQTSLGLFI